MKTAVFSLVLFAISMFFYLFFSFYSSRRPQENFAESNRQLRIVSLAPPATNQLAALGKDYLLVGKTAFCLGGENAQIVGDVINISGEAVMVLNPDVILAGSLTNRSLTERLQTANIEVVIISDPRNYEELRANFRKIAEIADALPKADSILAVVDARLSQIRTQNENLANRPLIFVQLSVNPIFTVMKNTLGHEMIELSGGRNAFELEGGALVSAEAVVAANPDMIIVADMEEFSKDELARWARFENISAVKNGALHIFDAHKIGSPTPISFLEAVEKIRSLL